MKTIEVGKGIEALLDITKDYITAHTVKGLYKGELHYLQTYQKLYEVYIMPVNAK